MFRIKIAIYIALFFILSHYLMAQIPVMNTLPRWNNGYGLQYRYEYLQVEDPSYIETHISSFEGVVSILKEIRFVFRLPLLISVDQHRKHKVGLHTSDITLIGKYYWNKKNLAASLGSYSSLLFPQINIPHLKNWGVAFGVVGDIENYYWLATLHYEFRYFPLKILEHHFEPNLGYHLFHNNKTNFGIWFILGLSISNSNVYSLVIDLGTDLDINFAALFYINNILLRIKYSLPLYKSRKKTNHSQAQLLISLGYAFIY